MSQVSAYGSPWQGSLKDLALIIRQVQRIRAFGRLSLRNPDRFCIIHLYYRAGKLVQVVGNRSDVRALLLDLREWRRGGVRFDRGVMTQDVPLSNEHEKALEETLAHLKACGVMAVPPRQEVPQIIEGRIVAHARDARQLMAPWEWQLLIEATRRVSLAVARLVGPREAFKVLQDILDDCSSAFPAFSSLTVASSGYLQIADRSYLDTLSREELLEGFTALIATSQYFCSPIIGEREAHELIIRALQDIGPPLVNLGVFRVDKQLLAGPRKGASS